MPFSIEQVKQIPPKTLLKLLNRAKEFLKRNEVMKDLCKEHGVDVSVIDFIPIKFGDLDVSARTERGVITLNYKLLCDGNFFKDYHYLIHECQHYLDQCYGDKPTPGADDGDYLSNPAEERGFQRQLEFIDHMFGKDEADKYVEHLLDHHKVDDEERDERKEVLMKRVD